MSHWLGLIRSDRQMDDPQIGSSWPDARACPAMNHNRAQVCVPVRSANQADIDLVVSLSARAWASSSRDRESQEDPPSCLKRSARKRPLTAISRCSRSSFPIATTRCRASAQKLSQIVSPHRTRTRTHKGVDIFVFSAAVDSNVDPH